MKKFLIAVFALAILFAGCVDQDTPEDDPDDLERPITSVTLNLYDKTLYTDGEKTFDVTASVTPSSATERGVTWGITSSDPEGVVSYEIKQADASGNTITVTALKAGTAVITATSKGLNSSGVTMSRSVNIIVKDEAPDVSSDQLHWNFQTLPDGWLNSDGQAEFSNTIPGSANGADLNYGNGMKLLGATGTDANGETNVVNSDFGSGNRFTLVAANASSATNIVWQTIQGVDMEYPFTDNNLRLNRGTYAAVDGVKGPYIIVINFQSGGSSNERWPLVKIGGTHYNLSSSAGHRNCSESTGGTGVGTTSGFNQLKVIYNGTDSPQIIFKDVGGCRIWDI